MRNKAEETNVITNERCFDKFNPLPRILYHADFDTGYNGFTETIGNYEGTLDEIIPEMADFRPPQLSNRPMWDTGSAGSLDGTYALKLATRPRRGSIAVCTKRLVWTAPTRIRMETWFGFKSEATELRVSDKDVRGFGFVLDLQDDRVRMLPRVRYLHAKDGLAIGKWQIKVEGPPKRDIGGAGETVSYNHYSEDGYADVPGGSHETCFNELATKMNWHYLAVTFNLRSMRFETIRCNDIVMDASTIAPFALSPMPNLRGLLNTIFFVESDVDKRAFLYMDSILYSVETH
jgi:hypothetical protein